MLLVPSQPKIDFFVTLLFPIPAVCVIEPGAKKFPNENNSLIIKIHNFCPILMKLGENTHLMR